MPQPRPAQTHHTTPFSEDTNTRRKSMINGQTPTNRTAHPKTTHTKTQSQQTLVGLCSSQIITSPPTTTEKNALAHNRTTFKDSNRNTSGIPQSTYLVNQVHPHQEAGDVEVAKDENNE